MNSDPAACPLCGSTKTRVRFPGTTDWATSADQAFLCTTTTRIRPEVWECSSCTHQFSNPAHWPTDLGSEYGSLEDSEYLSMLGIKRKTFAKAATLVEKYVSPPARLLEIGSYVGLFLETCRDRGFQVTGIEPSVWGATHAQQKRLDVRNGTAEELLGDADLGLYDAVVSWDVLEHVPDPAHFVELAAGHVTPGGYLILSTLDRSNWFARLMGKRWPWLIPMHLHYFDQKAVIRMAESCGFTYISTKAHVHYTSAGYAWKRLVGHDDHVEAQDGDSALDRMVFPVGFGDVRLYVFRNSEAGPR